MIRALSGLRAGPSHSCHEIVGSIMLQRMRTSTGSWIAKGILGLLVLSFLGWGVADYTTSGSTGTVVAKVGDREIGYQEFQLAYQRFLRGQRLNAVDPEVARQLRLAESVVQNLASTALYEAEASDKNLTASDAMVRRAIEERPEFRAGGNFSRAAFENALARLGLNEAAYVETARRELGRGQLIGAVTSGSDAPPSLVDMLFDHFGERRSVEYMVMPITAVVPQGNPEEDELKALYEERKEDFRRPELRSMTYVLISPEALARDIEITDQEVTDAFEQRRDSYGQPERRTLSQILFASADEARATAEALKGLPPADVAVKVEEMDLDLIELGTFTKEAVPNEGLAEAAFALDSPGATDAFEGAFGWSIAVVTAIEEGVEPNLEEVRESLAADLALDRAYDEVFERGKQLEDAYGQGMSLEEAAQSVGLEVHTVEAVDASGHGPTGDALEGLPAGLKFLRTAFDLETGDVSFLETSESNAMFMVRVDAITPSAIPSYDEVAAQVGDVWREEALFDAAEKRAEILAERLSEGSELSVLAQIMGAEFATIEELARDGLSAGGNRLPQALARELFALSVGEATYAADGDNFIIARLTGVKPAGDAADEAFRQTLANAVTTGMAQDLVEQLGVALRDRYTIETNPEVYEQVYR